MKKIGIIGRGFVGSAVEFGFSAQTGCDAQIKVYDKDPAKSIHTLEDTVNESDFIFLSVPTPSNEDGSMHLGILESVLQDIQVVNKRKDNIILIRSTIIPGTTTKLCKKYKKLNIVFNPEFLTERSAKFDFINQSRFILGGRKRNTARVADLYRWRFGDSVPCIETNFETAEMIKYMNNCFFATKVSFMNEMKLIADKSNVDWDLAVDGFVRDGRIGHSHLAVPGPDGKRGFGGSCFPKDIQAMINFGKNLDVDMNTYKLAGSGTYNEIAPDAYGSNQVNTEPARTHGAIVNFSATNPFADANFLVAISSLRIIPNSSSSSGSAFVTPRISLLKESVKSRPRVTEANLAPFASSVICVAVNPAAEAIAVCCAASWKANNPPVACLTEAVIDSKEVPVICAKARKPLI